MGTVADPEGVTAVDCLSIKSGAALLAAPAESVLLKSPEILVHTCHERELAVSHWLLAAAQYMREARKEWAVAGIALLRCGGNFSAIRVPAEVVHAAAGAEDLHQVDDYPSDALPGGPVFVDVTSRRYSSSYQRVPCDKLCGNPGSCRMRSVSGPAGLLGVPTPNATDPYAARSYWCVPMDSPGELCDPQAVSQFCSWCETRKEGTRIVRAFEAASGGSGGALYACQPCRDPHGLTASRPHGLTASRPHGLTASRPHGLTASRPHGLTASRPHGLTASRPHGLTASRPHGLTASRPHGLTASRPHGLTASRPHGLTASRPHGLTASRPHGLTASRPHGLTASRPHGLTASRPHGLTASRPHAARRAAPCGVTPSPRGLARPRGRAPAACFP